MAFTLNRLSAATMAALSTGLPEVPFDALRSAVTRETGFDAKPNPAAKSPNLNASGEVAKNSREQNNPFNAGGQSPLDAATAAGKTSNTAAAAATGPNWPRLGMIAGGLVLVWLLFLRK